MPINTAERPAPSRSRAKAAAQAALLHSLLKDLAAHFGPQNWWPAESAWEMLAGAILTQNTSWTNVEKALAKLKAANALSLEATARLPLRRLEGLIRSSGYFRQKARRLRGFARFLTQDAPLRRALTESFKGKSVDTQTGPEALTALRSRLLSILGIGPETADSMLLYAGSLPIFVIDAYTRRIGQRMGLFRTDDYHEAQRFFHSRLAPAAGLFNEFHALLVMLAKHYCRKHKPLCGACPARKHCAFGRKIRRP
jgi:endonuclease III related protein